jgi:flagellar hook protein FlgE
MKQGSVVQSDRKLDVSIMGDGWFAVQNGEDGVAFTRNGSFSYDVNGRVVNNDGAYVMGTLSEDIQDGRLSDVSNFAPLATSDNQTTLQLPNDLTLGGVPTKNVSIHGNLGIEGVTGKFATTIFTEEGKKNTLKLRIEKDFEQPERGSSWSLVATVLDEAGAVKFESKPSKILFGSNGAVVKYDKPKIKNGGVNINLNLETKFGGLVTLGGNYIGKEIVSDGVSEGKLIEYHIDRKGQIMANFDNGRASAVGKIALFHFQNDQGLNKIGDNLFTQSANSGEAFFYKDALGRDAAVTELMPYALEKSNVSTAEALTQLIVMQKAFDASAKSITTGDQLLQTALKMV